MKKTFLLLSLSTLLFSSTHLLAQNTSASLTDDLDKMFQETFKADGPGASVLVTQKGKVLYKKAFGMANLELDVPLNSAHVFRIGSISKQFTAVAILKLMEAGKLSLQDELTKFIPDYPTQGKKITVEQLLQHSSGIKSYTEMQTWDEQLQRKDFSPMELVDFFKNEPMDFEPGTEWRYDNSGYILLGVIIEKVSGQTYGDYISEQFFKPLGMKNSYYGDTKPLIKNRATGYSRAEETGTYHNAAFLSMTQPYAAGSLLSTVEDLNTWTIALHSGKVIKPETFKKAITPCILPNGTNTHYGFGLQIGNLFGSQTIEHGGGIHGFLSDLVYLPKEALCVAILTNCDCEAPSAFSHRVAARTLNKPYQPTPIKVDPKSLDQYIGVYENEKMEQRIITAEDGQLFSQRTGGSKYKLTPYGPDQFWFENSDARIRFIREKSGARNVVKANVSDRFSEENLWEKTDKPLPEAKAEMQLTKAQLQPFVGEYELMPGFHITVTLEDTQLTCQATGQGAFEVYPSSKTRFFLKVVDAEIEFFPSDNGTVDKLILFQGGQELEGVRVKK